MLKEKDQSYLRLVSQIQAEYYPGRNDRIQLLQAYDPAIERARILTFQNRGGLREEARRSITTTLAERLHVESTSDCYMPEQMQDVLDMIQRGIVYRQFLGSPDQERELAEAQGWQFIIKKMAHPDTSIGTTIVSLSPPSPHPDSPYKFNFVDQFTLVEEEGKRRIRRRRTSVNFCPEDYEAFALTADPNYFANCESGPCDAWFLGHPFFSNQEIPRHRVVGMPPTQFEKIVQQCSQFIEAHLGALFVGDKEMINLTLSALLNRADLGYQVNPQQFSIDILGRLPVRQVAGGCGFTGGIMSKNSVSSFAEKSDYGPGQCKNCHLPKPRVGPCKICTDCERFL